MRTIGHLEKIQFPLKVQDYGKIKHEDRASLEISLKRKVSRIITMLERVLQGILIIKIMYE
jgi:hypothetical protein